jgi:uncharacterized protein YecE (DUF72 family)
LVCAADSENVDGAEYLALPVGPSRRARTVEAKADFVYIRGHGPGGRYKGHYPQTTLTEWAKRIRSWKKRGCDVYVYFDNDQKSAAPADALKLRQMLM